MQKNINRQFISKYCFSNSLLFIILAFGFLYSSPFPSGLLSWSFALMGGVGFMAFLGYFYGMILLTMLRPLLRGKKSIIGISAVLYGVFLSCMVADLFVLHIYKSHINWVIVRLIMSSERSQVFDLSASMYAIIITFILALFVLEFILATVIYKHSVETVSNNVVRKYRRGWRYPVMLLMLFMGSNAVYACADLHSNTSVLLCGEVIPFYYGLTIKEFAVRHHLISQQQILRSQRLNALTSTSVKTLHYPLHPLVLPKHLTHKPNILVLMIDTWRADMFTPQTSPHIYDLGKHALVFAKHRSGGDCTKPGVFTFFYGIPSTYYARTFNGRVPPVWFDVLKQEDYQLFIHASASLAMPTFYGNVFSSVKHLQMNSPGDSSWQRDEYITNRMLTFLHKKHHKPFFGFLFFDSVHGYTFPPTAQKPFVPYKPLNVLAALSSKNPQPYINMYKNAVHFDDSLVGKIISTLKQQGLWENTIVIITADHGEEFNDNHQGYWGHDGNLTRVQTHVPLIIHWPGYAAKRYGHTTTHYDIFATLLKRVFKVKNPMRDFSEGQDLFSSQGRYPMIISRYMHHAIVQQDRAIHLLRAGIYSVYNDHAKLLEHAKVSMLILAKGYRLMHRFD